MDSSVDEDSVAQGPSKLYHYTRQQGLLGIAESSAIWASKIQYFNDQSEFHLALDLAVELCRAAGSIFSDSMIRDIESMRFANIFVVSLSAEPDLLSQWRAYGEPGDAYSVGLDFDAIQAIADLGNWQLLECIYDAQDHHDAVSDLITRHLQGAADDGSVRPSFLEEISAVAVSAKHPSFMEEREWRLVSGIMDEKRSPFHFRGGRYTLIPYMEFPVAVETEDGSETIEAFKEVIVGPSPYPELSIQSCAGMLRHFGIVGDVRRSESTFRAW
ncbi:MAG: hypothetical protein QOG04_243 [Actinomycetota bacterium]|jgi:hypothetical protein|nr:hypothetical protein [Actinomycetota bacterium]